MIIGITGRYCAGKDTAAEYFIKKEYIHYSLSDFIREEAKKRGLTPDRPTLIKLGNELREKNGPSVLAKMALAQMMPGKNYVITSIRNTAEVEELRKRKDFLFIAIDASVEIRWKRMQQRPDRPDNIKNLEDFISLEKQESSRDSTKQQLNLVFALADKVIMNDKDKKELYQQLDKLL